MIRSKKLNKSLWKYQTGKITKENLRRLLEKGVLGRVAGVIGPFVIRYQNGKLIISDRPKMFRKSMSSAAVKGRASFASGVRFANEIMKYTLLKRAWTEAEIEGRAAWNRIIKYNYTAGIPSINNTVTPPDYHFHTNLFCSLDEKFRITIHKEDGIDEQSRIFIVIVPFNPGTKRYEIISMEISGDENFLRMDKQQRKIFRNFPDYNIYAAVIRKRGESLKWSDTKISTGRIINKTAEENIAERNIWLLWCFINQYSKRIKDFTGKRFIIQRRN